MSQKNYTWKVGDRVVATKQEKLRNILLVDTGDKGTIKQKPDGRGRAYCKWDVERDGSDEWWIDEDGIVSEELWNTALMKAIREDK